MKRTVRSVIKWSIYWLLVLGLYVCLSLVFGDFVLYLPFVAFALINYLIRVLLHMPFRHAQRAWVRKAAYMAVNVVSIAVMVFFVTFSLQAGVNFNIHFIDGMNYDGFSHNSQVEYHREEGYYTVTATTDELRILQLTDIHLGGSLATVNTDRRALNACYELIREAKPDLIIVTGDVVYPIPVQTFSRDNLTPLGHFCHFMNKVGIPWAMVYGNHETEAIASYDKKAFDGLFRSIIQDENNSLLYAEHQPDIYGRYNSYLELRNQDGSLNRLLFLIDSNDYKKGTLVKEYDSVHSDQMLWYHWTVMQYAEQEGHMVPSFVYMHIPFQEFALAREAYGLPNSDCQWLFGTNREPVSHPAHNSGFFDLMKDLGSTQAVFVGHDHLNNAGYKYQGIDLVYGKSIDYIAYPGISNTRDQRGATLVTVKVNGYVISQVDSLSW